MICPQNVLFGYLPEAVTVSGTEYPINTGFRVWLQIGEILASADIPERKAAKIIRLCYKGEYPENKGIALSQALCFYKNAFPSYGKGGGENCFSADLDGKLLYSGFLKAYGIDLSREDIHWYRFAPLMYELSDCAISKIMEFRTTDLSNIPKAYRNLYLRMKRKFALKSPFSDGEFAKSLFELF